MDSVSSSSEPETAKQSSEREVPVTVSGRGVGADTGEAFTEQTTTKAIFENGAVVRLSAEVNEGQAVRIRNAENGREAAARVTKSLPSEGGAKCAELEFAEAAPGFWAIESANVAEPAVKLALAPIGEPKPEQIPVPAEPAPQTETSTAPQPSTPEEFPAWMKVNKAWEGGESYPIRMQLPKAGDASPRTAEFAADSATITAAQDEYLLPKPSLDFEQFPGLAEEKTKLLSGTARRSLSGPIGVLVLIVLLLAAAGIGSYRMGLLGRTSEKATKRTTEPSLQPTSSSDVKTMRQYPFDIPAPKAEKASADAAPEVALGKNEEARDTETHPAETAGKVRASGKKTAGTPGVKTRGLARVGTNNAVNPAASQEDVYEPPKLIRAVRSLSPPEALQAFVSGVVTLDALVDENGKVLSVTPISGPKALYEKAAQTVKEGYLYEPARKNGKPVQAHVNARIQFWYEP